MDGATFTSDVFVVSLDADSKTASAKGTVPGTFERGQAHICSKGVSPILLGGTRKIGTDPDRIGTGSSNEFIAGPENRLAAAVVEWLAAGDGWGYSPVVLYGPSGVGKTLLCEGIARCAGWPAAERKRCA